MSELGGRSADDWAEMAEEATRNYRPFRARTYAALATAARHPAVGEPATVGEAMRDEGRAIGVALLGLLVIGRRVLLACRRGRGSK